jgi:hypothetical protein
LINHNGEDCFEYERKNYLPDITNDKGLSDWLEEFDTSKLKFVPIGMWEGGGAWNVNQDLREALVLFLVKPLECVFVDFPIPDLIHNFDL